MSMLVNDEETFEYPADVRAIVFALGFWRQLVTAMEILKRICSTTIFLETNAVPLSATYGIFLFLKHHFSVEDFSAFSGTIRELAVQKIEFRFSTIQHPIHACAFCFDPFWDDFRLSFTSEKEIKLGPKHLEGIFTAQNSAASGERYFKVRKQGV